MNNITVSGKACVFKKKYAKKVALKVLELMGQPDCLDVAIEFVTEDEIQRLNREIRNIDKVTDVLSFPSTEITAGEILDVENEDLMFLVGENGCVHFGDMALCLAQCKRQAKEYGVSLKSEIKKLVIHSMLHLMGYDHIKDEDFEVMNKKEKELDEKIF